MAVEDVHSGMHPAIQAARRRITLDSTGKGDLVDGTQLLARIWRQGPSADLGQRRAYGFLRLANLLRDDRYRLGVVLTRAYVNIGSVPPDTDHAEFWARGNHPIQLAATAA
jgi:hypothetical protein